MSAIAPAVPLASTAPPPVAPSHPASGGAHGFSAALDALTAGGGKARSTEDDGKHATEDPSDSTSTPPSSDLRAALIGGALASLAVAPAAAPGVGARPADDSAGGTVAESVVRKIASAAGVNPTESTAAASPAASGATPTATAGVGASLTAERTYLAPPAFGPAAHAAAAPSADPASTFDSSSAAIRPASAPGDVETVHEGRPETKMAERTSAASPDKPWDAPSAATRQAGPPDRAVGPEAQAFRSASPALSEPRPAAAAPGALRRVPPSSSRESGPTVAATSGSAGASATVATPDPAKAHADSELDRGLAEGEGLRPSPAVAAAIGQANASSFGAAPAQAAFSLSDSAARPAAAVPQTRAPMASTAPLTGKVREIDLDLGASGLKDVTMTVRLAGDKLGVVVRAANGETAATIEGARDAIAERLAAIGQPVTSLIIQQTGASDAKGATGQSAGEGDGGASQGQGREAGDPRGSRRGSSRF